MLTLGNIFVLMLVAAAAAWVWHNHGLRERALEMLGAPEELDRVLSENAAKAETVANRTLNDVYERVGLLRRV